MDCLSFYLLYEGLVEKSKTEIEYCENRAQKLFKYEDPYMLNVKRKIYDLALELVNNNIDKE